MKDMNEVSEGSEVKAVSKGGPAMKRKKASRREHCDMALRLVGLIESREETLEAHFNRCMLRSIIETLLDQC